MTNNMLTAEDAVKVGFPEFLRVTPAEAERRRLAWEAAPPRPLFVQDNTAYEEQKSCQREAKIAAMKKRMEAAAARRAAGEKYDSRKKEWIKPKVTVTQDMRWDPARGWVEDRVIAALRRFDSGLAPADKPDTSHGPRTRAAPRGPRPGDQRRINRRRVTMAKKEKASRVEKEIFVAPGKVADFRQVRAGSARATVVGMAGKSSGATVDEIAKAINKDRKTVLTHLFCMGRSPDAGGCGYGYEVKGGKAYITFPGSKTVKDAIKEPAEEKKAA
jgi:hypothetical protein